MEKGLVPRGKLSEEARLRATKLLGSAEAQKAVGSGDPVQTKLAAEVMRLLGGESAKSAGGKAA